MRTHKTLDMSHRVRALQPVCPPRGVNHATQSARCQWLQEKCASLIGHQAATRAYRGRSLNARHGTHFSHRRVQRSCSGACYCQRQCPQSLVALHVPTHNQPLSTVLELHVQSGPIPLHANAVPPRGQALPPPSHLLAVPKLRPSTHLKMAGGTGNAVPSTLRALAAAAEYGVS